MDDRLLMEIPEPRYAIGAMVLALINHQPRYARIEKAHLDAHVVFDDEGPALTSDLRWEYDVLVINDPVEASERMIVAERTILFEIDPDTYQPLDRPA